MRVIIADDEPIIRMDLKEILEKEGYTEFQKIYRRDN